MGLKEVAIELVLGLKRVVIGSDSIVVASFVSDLEEFSLSLLPYSGKVFETGVSILDVIRREEELVSCDFTRNPISVVHLMSLEQLDALNSVDTR
jgi:hypothetical protein